MNKLIRFFNRNRMEIIVGIVIIAFILFIIKTINGIYKQQDNSVANNLQEGNSIVSIESLNEVKEKESTAIMNQKETDKKETQDNLNLIRTFIDKCNQGAIEEAYQMLSKEMRDLFYRELDTFKSNYVDIIFTTSRTPEIEAWYTSKTAYTYRVILYENILANGSVNNDNTFEDYYTIITENGEKKINLNKFIEANKIEKIVENEFVRVEIQNQYKFKEYEQFQLTIRNITNEKIALDTLENIKTIYITGDNNVQYEAFSAELGKSLLVLEPYQVGTYLIKFNKIYNPNIESQSITFSDVVLNYNNWVEGEEKTAKSITINW